MSSQLSVFSKLCIMNTLLHFFLLFQFCGSQRNISLCDHILGKSNVIITVGWSWWRHQRTPLISLASGPPNPKPTTGYKPTWLTAISSHFLLHYLPKCLHSTATCGKTPATATFNVSSKICCHVIVTQQSPIAEQNSHPSFGSCLCRQTQRHGFGELHAHRCVLPEQWIWRLLCTVSVISENKLSSQELTNLIRIKLLISRFL